MAAASDFAPLELRFVDQIPWRYELIRPLVLFEDRPARQRAHETHTHPATVRKLRRRFEHQGMLGLLLDDVEVVPKEKTARVSPAVAEEIARLKALSAGFHARELVRIVFYKLDERIDHKTARRLWQQRPVVAQEALPLGDYPSQPDRYQARLQVIKLYAQGWEKISLSRFLHGSRPTVDAWITRLATEHVAGLLDKSSAPKAPARKVWLPLMIEVYPLPKRHPDAGKCRLWSLLAHPEISVRTVARIMALNKEVYDAIPHVRKKGPKRPPQPHPYKTARPPTSTGASMAA
jgi:hypothetical protein